MFQRAKGLAEQASDLGQVCRVQLDLVANLADSLGREAVASALNECHRAVVALGHPHTEARLHIIAAEIEGKFGLLDQAESHLRMAELSLSANPNVWLEGLLWLNASTVHALKADPFKALELAEKALECSEASGHLRTKLGSVANLAFLKLWTGDVASAADRCREGLDLASNITEVRLALLETQAQVMLVTGDLPKCRALLSQVEGKVPHNQRLQPTWYQLATALTRARVQLKDSQWQGVVSTCRSAAKLSDQRGDRLHGISLRVLGADALIELDRLDEAGVWVNEAAELATQVPTAVHAEVERARAALLARTAGPRQARRPFERALRLLAAVGGISDRMDASASYVRTMNPVNEGLRRQLETTPYDLTPLLEGSLLKRTSKPHRPETPVAERATLELGDLLPLLTLAHRPDLCAREALVALRESGHTASLAIVEKRGSQVLDVTCHEGWSADQAARAADRQTGVVSINTGNVGEREFHVIVLPNDDVPSKSFVHSFKAFVDNARVLESFREQERARSALQPPAEFAARADGVFASESMLKLLEKARLAAAGDSHILITGETGVGKEVFARIIHKYSARASKDFVPFNCSSVPQEMVESQLFGHRRGAFTGAIDNAPGVIRGASGGTLLLDEIGDLKLAVQPQLLRFLENNEVHPVGEPRPVAVDVRVIAATNAKIDQRVRDGRFREDLFYRLNIFRLDVPPLRERREEIPILVYHLLQRYATEAGRQPEGVDDEAMKYLLLYAWPGNVRQLASEVRRSSTLANGRGPIGVEHLSPEVLDAGRAMATSVPPSAVGDPDPAAVRVRLDQPLAHAVADVERAVIAKAFEDTDGRPTPAARRLGITRKGLALKCRRLGIEAPDARLRRSARPRPQSAGQ